MFAINKFTYLNYYSFHVSGGDLKRGV